MGLFGSLFGGKVPEFDKTEGHPQVRDGLSYLQTGRLSELAALYRAQSPADRTLFVQAIGELVPMEFDWPDHDDDVSLMAIEGGARVIIGHRMRGYATADRTKAEAAYRMFNMVEQAIDLLDEAASQVPTDSVVQAFRLRASNLTGMHEREGLDAIRREFENTGEANVLGAFQVLTYLCEKWHGSAGEMRAFADRCVETAPNASYYAIKARSHIEDWLYEIHMSDDPTRRAAFRARMTSPEFLADVSHLDDTYWAHPSRNGLSYAEQHFAANQFGALFALLRLPQRAKPHLEQIGAYPSSTPWAYISPNGNEMAEIVRQRKACGLPKL